MIAIDTEIVLQEIQLSDAEEIFNTIVAEREYLGKWLPFVDFTKEVSDTEKFIESVLSQMKNQRDYTFTIRKNHQFVGLIGLKETDVYNRKTEMGYWLSQSFQHQGIMTKSVKVLCEFAFEVLKLNRIQIKCGVGNTPSRNIPKRLGFQLEGIERAAELHAGNRFIDLEIYGLLQHEFNKNI